MTLSPTTSTPPPPADSPAVLTAVLERVTYSNEETGYIVARVTTGRDGDLLTVVGPLAGAQPGEHLRMEGRWRNHAMYGRQFEVHGYTRCPGSAPSAPHSSSARGRSRRLSKK